MTYFDKLREASRARDSLLCVGLDPEPARIGGGAEEALKFCVEVVERTADLACCYKPNSAFWEQYGADGWHALASLRAHIPDEIPVLLDAKRADVGNTMAAYARAVYDALGMDACTVHAYHGTDSLETFTAHADRGVYVVCHTSNPGRVDLQHIPAPDEPLYLRVAALAERMNEHRNVGVVCGATAPHEAAVVRRALPEMPFLLPGVGRQGGDLEAAVRAAWNGDPASCLVAISGAILYADDPAAAARGYRDKINACLSPAR